MRPKEKHVVTTVLSAIAAQPPVNGLTAHSTIQTSVPIEQDITCKISTDCPGADNYRPKHLIIWDEIVVTHKDNLETVDQTISDVIHCTHPFGGNRASSFDFREVLPDSQSNSQSQIVGACFSFCDIICFSKFFVFSRI